MLRFDETRGSVQRFFLTLYNFFEYLKCLRTKKTHKCLGLDLKNIVFRLSKYFSYTHSNFYSFSLVGI